MLMHDLKNKLKLSGQKKKKIAGDFAKASLYFPEAESISYGCWPSCIYPLNVNSSHDN